MRTLTGSHGFMSIMSRDPVTFKCSPATKHAIEEMAEEKDISVSELCRTALIEKVHNDEQQTQSKNVDTDVKELEVK